MGNHYSDMKNSLSNSSSSIPKHLKPSTTTISCCPIQQLQQKVSSTTKKTNNQKQTSSQKASTPLPPPVTKAVTKTTSLKSSSFSKVQDEEEKTISIGSGSFQWYEGRRYYASQNQQILPNDQIELERLGVLNFILRWAFKGYIVAPIHDELLKGIDVLNVGYGPGLWPGHQIIDLALDYRNSKFTATDIINLLPADSDKSPLTSDINKRAITHSLNPHSGLNDNSLKDGHTTSSINNDSGRVLDNLDFYQCNIVESKLPFEDNTFDFVKQQLGTTSFTVKDWIHIIKEIVRVTKPGGYIQLIEIDYHTSNLGPNGLKWETHLLKMTREKRQLEPRMATYISDLLNFIGLTDVSSKLVSIPLGSWGLDLGELWKKNLEMFIDATSPLMSQVVGLSVAEYKEQWNNSMTESQANKPFSNLHAAYGRKPLHPLDLDHIDWSIFPPFTASIL